MEGVIFYWLFWLLWIYSTFLMKKGKERLKVSIWLLLTMIFSIHSLQFFHLHISFSSLFILMTVYYLIGKLDRWQGIYTFISSLIMLLSYMIFHLFELYDPVWVLFNRCLMLSFLLVSLAVLLHKELKLRLLAIISGAAQGDFLYGIYLRKFSIVYPIGMPAFLDVLALSITILLGINGLKKLSLTIENHLKHLEKEKQKLS